LGAEALAGIAVVVVLEVLAVAALVVAELEVVGSIIIVTKAR
jgi:hypothetical protein